MNKRGQIYILAAFIVCMLAFLLVSTPNIIREKVLLQNFEDLSNNYLTESPKIVNEALDEKHNIQGELGGFTKKFIENYAENQDPKIGLIYIYSDKNGVIIQNYLNNEKARFISSSNLAGEILLSYDTPVTGDIVFVGTGTGTPTITQLCASGNENYCALPKNQLPPGIYTLEIGDIKYKFEITQESPELIVIVKSTSEDGSTVKVDVSESKL